MEFIKKNIEGIFEIKLNPINDKRGFFMRVMDDKLFKNNGITFKWIQENHSRSVQRGIIRGLHLQLPPFAETKLVRCVRGKVLDVYVDLRKNSKTFGKWGSVELCEERKNMILIPRGFAHGFCTLTEESEVIYKVDNYYSKDHEVGIIWNDIDLEIDWPEVEPILSKKDYKNITLSNFISKYNGVDA